MYWRCWSGKIVLLLAAEAGDVLPSHLVPSRRVLDLAIKVGVILEVAVRSGGSGKVWR
jgi:hypothetical protein